ncbi:MAG: CBS domain-containing protein [Nitrososphaeria archaeon]|jgi:CBS domain-containing protein
MESSATNPANITVREVMNSPVITGGPDETVRQIAQKMTESSVGSIVIVENKLPIGMVTDGDIIYRVVSSGLDPDKTKAREIMSTPIYTVESEAKVIDAVKYMRKKKVKRVGVTYRGNLEGILSLWDIIAITPELVEIFSERLNIETSFSESQKGSIYMAGYCDICSRWSDTLVEVDDKYLCDECRSE